MASVLTTLHDILTTVSMLIQYDQTKSREPVKFLELTQFAKFSDFIDVDILMDDGTTSNNEVLKQKCQKGL